MQHPFIPAAYIWAAFVVLISALLIYLTTRSRRESKRNKRPLPTGAELIARDSVLPPEHAYFGLWQHLFKYRNFTENELQQIVGHCDHILQATAHQNAVMEWERTMMELVCEDTPASVTKAVDGIRRQRDQYFDASQAWAKLMQKHFGTMVLGDADKAIRSMLEMEAKHNDELKRANERADHNRREMVQQSATATALRQERDQWKERGDGWAEECKNWENTYNRLREKSNQLESELDRGNETITWMRSDLSTAYAIIKEQEAVLASLGIKEPRRRDEKGRFAPNVIPAGTVKEGDVLSVQMVGRVQRPKLLNVTATPKVVDEAGEDLRKQPREVSSLTEKEAIQVNNEAERDAILKLMDADGLVWNSGAKATRYIPEKFPNSLGLTNGRIVCNFSSRSRTILPASDFLPAEQPTAEFSGKPFYTDAQLKEIEEVNNSTKTNAKPLALTVDTGRLPAEDITFDASKVYPIHDNYQQNKGPVGSAKIYLEGGFMFASIITINDEFLSAYNDGKVSLYIGAHVDDNVAELTELSFCPRREQLEPIEPRKDHPCLKGCIAPLGGHCNCPVGAPKFGEVRFTHDRDFFVGNGVLIRTMTAHDQKAVKEWAEKKGLKYFGLANDPVAGLDPNTFCFSRPAVNSDFDACNANA